MGLAARAAPALLLHVNLLLMLYAGAMLGAAARLAWDPSAYVPARELFPRELRALAAALPALAAALLLLAHLALLAVRRPRRAPRRRLLVLVACGQAALAGGWAALGGWAWRRAARWAGGRAAAELRQALALQDHVLPLLQQLARYHPLPGRIAAVIQEAQRDLPRMLRALQCAAALLLLLQLLAAAAALAAARARPHRALSRSSPRDVRAAPPRAAYRAGRLVLL